MVKYPNINDKDFQKKIKQIFSEYKLKKKEKKSIKDFCYPKKFTFQLPQLFVAEFLNPKTPYKGVLLYHRIGAGKTCAGIQIAENWKKYKKIILVAPASLTGNFYKELRSGCTGNEYITKDEREKLKVLDPRSKMANEIIAKTKERINEYYEIYSYHKYAELYTTKKLSLKNKLLIIDEVHNIVSEDGTFYNIFKESIDKSPDDCRIVIMSATPIFDKPSELGMTINLLKPNNELPLPNDFNKIFINKKEIDGNIVYKLINEDKLSKYIQGYVSYYQGAPAFLFPKTNIKYVKCRMSKFQSDAYKSFIEQEKKGLFTQSDILKLPSSFLLGGRMISNIAYPNKKIGEKGIDSLTKKYSSFDNLKRYSIKFYKILKKVDRCSGPVFFYTNFKEHGGLEDFKRIIEFHGYTNILDQNESSGKKKYAIWSGDENNKEKDLIRELFNSKDNEDGSKIKIILGSPAIKEGVSLLRVRQVHILEPYWNMSRIDQVIGRAVRFCSHKDLKKDDRLVSIYIYIAIDDTNEISIDQHILSIAFQKKLLIEQFETVLKKSAIDYYLFQK
jgi:superfamily II DNA or RNA helicase